MRLAGLDLETTGLDTKKDRILKLGLVLMEEGNPVPLFEKEWTLWHDTYPAISKEAFEAHGIKKEVATEFGETPIGFYFTLAQFMESARVDYLVAHNGISFDFPMLDANADAFDTGACSFFRKLKKVDTCQDISFPLNITTRKLSYLAVEHGFMNPFPHSALSDIRTMFEILSHYDLEMVLERATSPTITIQAMTDYQDRQLAKDRRFYWCTPSQRWLKNIKQCDLDFEKTSANFNIAVVR